MSVAPPSFSITRVPLPPDRVLSYAELASLTLSYLPAGPVVLLGESFSGPLALRLSGLVRPAGVVLCASFIRARALHRLAALPLSRLLRAVPPVAVIKSLLAGGDEQLASDLVHAVLRVNGDVLASRLRMVLEADARADLRAFQGPLLYLRAARDLVVSARQAAMLSELRPDAAVATIDAPHLLLQAEPAACWERITSFVAAEVISRSFAGAADS